MVDTATAAPPVRTAVARRAGNVARGVAHHVLGLPLAVVAFVAAAAGVPLGAGTLVVWVGVPVLAATLAVSRWLAGVERRRSPWR